MKVALLTTLLLLATHSAFAQRITDEEVQYLNQSFERWWGSPLDWRFKDLPDSGAVPPERMPYAGYIYPDTAGGTEAVLWKYDDAFHNGRSLAVAFERHDIASHRFTQVDRSSPLRRGRRTSYTPHWAGHCNGWTAAAIRHAAPEKSVVRHGITFSPADIKGLLAELYAYNETEFLGGIGVAVNAGTLHVALGNWIGLGQHPVGMDKSIGREVWNYPIYAYSSSSRWRGGQNVEVMMNVGYVQFTDREFDRARPQFKYLYFHYLLDLDAGGKIVGGRFYRDCQWIDMLWAPLHPAQGGTKGNEKGNPHLNAKEVLAMWRESVPREKRQGWMNIDPLTEDAAAETP